jgi:gluconate:H+ symporter, GntP family
LTSAGMRAAQGSATVAIVTAAGILAPLMKEVHGYSPEMLVLAICCGGTMLSHVNDAGFWLVKEYLGMTVAETLRSWTAMKIVMGVLGIVIVLICQKIFFHG